MSADVGVRVIRVGAGSVPFRAGVPRVGGLQSRLALPSRTPSGVPLPVDAPREPRRCARAEMGCVGVPLVPRAVRYCGRYCTTRSLSGWGSRASPSGNSLRYARTLAAVTKRRFASTSQDTGSLYGAVVSEPS